MRYIDTYMFMPTLSPSMQLYLHACMHTYCFPIATYVYIYISSCIHTSHIHHICVYIYMHLDLCNIHKLVGGLEHDSFPIQLGMSSSQLTSCPSFFRGVGQPPTSKDTSYTGTSVSSHLRSVTTGTPSSSPSEVGSGEEEVGGFNEIHHGIQILSLRMEFNGDLLGFTGVSW